MSSGINNNSPGKWEVVKKNKKPGGGPGKSSKSGPSPAAGGSRKALSESNMPKVETAPPIKTSETIYELAFDKQSKKQNKEQVPPSYALSEQQQQKKSSSGRQAKKSSTGEQNQKSGKFQSLEEAIEALDLTELEQQIEKSQTAFPENPTVWVKDLAGYLNYKLQAPETDPTQSQHTYDYPFCLASKELKNIIKCVWGRSDDVLEHFFDHCIYTMLRELDKPAGDALHGYRICIQAILMDKPRIATLHLKKYLELLRSHQNRPAKCLTIMWALGQAGFSDLAEGLKVWLGIMLPVLGIKSLSSYAVAYLDRLLMLHPNLTKGFGMVGPKDFFPLLDFAFMPNNSLTASLQDQLRHLYPRLKVLAYGAKPESTLHSYFPSFLSRATPSCPADMKKELLRSLNECLTMDPLSFSVWRQLYTKHLSQSSLLLNHLSESFDGTSKKMRASLQETIHSFRVTNEELLAKGQSNSQDIAACNKACNNLLQKTKGKGFPWSRLLVVCFVFVLGFVVHDIRTHGSFNASSSAHVLQQSGIMSISQQAWSKVSHYSLEGYSWLEANAPHYYSQAAVTLGPSLELAWNKTTEVATYTAEMCSTRIAWLRQNLPRFIEWLLASLPDAVFQCLEYIKHLLLFVLQKCLLPAIEYVQTTVEQRWKMFMESCKEEDLWLCFKEHLLNFTNFTWTHLQSTSAAVKNWTLSMISKL
ncbi:transmembrane protein 214 [Protopterus annectens]|uniref:transmembrane protein 214 n=1 Tax=Protopterus annectens TaxID=7888 RepID=UPI001CFBE957|nr:transmembrane protein 214 [Protopterus annectens]